MWIGKYKWEWITAILQPIMSFTIFALCYFTVLCLVFRHFFVIDVLLSPAMVALIVKMIATTLLGWSSPTLSTSMISWKIKWNKAITNTLLRQSYGDDTSVQDWNSVGYPVHVYLNTGIKGGKECKESFLCPFQINLRPTILPTLSISGGRSRSSDKGGSLKKKNFFRPFKTHFGLKLRGGGPPGPPGSATDQFFVFQVYNKATLSYTERKEVQRSIWGCTWESNLGHLTQKATH